jgi:hypothetical protein
LLLCQRLGILVLHSKEGTEGSKNNDIKKISSLAQRGGKIIFIVWAPHSVRAKEISKQLGCNIYFLHYKFKRKVYAPLKYPLLFIKSLRIMRRERPDVVLCQMPPPLCPLAAILHRSIFKRSAIMATDIHTAGLVKPWTYFRQLNKFVINRSSVAIVTNLEAQQTVATEYGITAFILEDKVPDFETHSHLNGEDNIGENGQHKKDFIFEQNKKNQSANNTQTHNIENNGTAFQNSDKSEKFTVVVPLSFSYDEPIENIMRAAAGLPDTTFYLTGDTSNAKREILQNNPQNVFFTGFLSDEDYHLLLSGADGIMALTTRDKTLLAGSYEAISLEKPLITSDWKPLKRYFTKGTLFVDNSSTQIKLAIQTLKKVHQDLKHEMHILKLEKQRDWETKFTELKSRLGIASSLQIKPE